MKTEFNPGMIGFYAKLTFSRIDVTHEMKRFWRTCNVSISRRQYSSARKYITQLKDLVGDSSVLTENIEKYTEDWTKQYSGGSVVVLPRTVDEVSKLLSMCNKYDIAVTPQGGNTGLVGGQVGRSNDDGVILSLERMNKILHVDEDAAVVSVEAGCVLELLNNAMEERGFIVPLDLGAKGSCQIGGNVATNAGGLRVVRYGSMHKNVLGLEVVLADGSILNMMRTLHKDNMGYHLKNLFIGSEGSLGVITKVSMQIIPKPISTNVVLLQIPSFKGLSSVLKVVRSQLNEIISAVEFMDQPSLKNLQALQPGLFQRLPKSMLPNSEGTGVVMLLETSGYCAETDTNRIEALLEQLLEKELVADAVVAQDETQFKTFWSLREQVPVALMQRSRMAMALPLLPKHSVGKLFKYDISLPLRLMPMLVDAVQGKLLQLGYPVAGQASCTSSSSADAETSQILRFLKEFQLEMRICCFGHLADQNLHLNILLDQKSSTGYRSSDEWDAAQLKEIHEIMKEQVDSAVYLNTLQLNGSLSAEHGVGQQKLPWMKAARSTEELAAMRQIKMSFDPKNILNPGKTVIL